MNAQWHYTDFERFNGVQHCYLFLIFFISYFLSIQGLQAIRCPAGLAFDIEKQTCNWKAAVKNCELRTKENKVKPLLYTDEPICQDAHLACGDGNCIEQAKFCNGEKDCNDGSDENACGKIIIVTVRA